MVSCATLCRRKKPIADDEVPVGLVSRKMVNIRTSFQRGVYGMPPRDLYRHICALKRTRTPWKEGDLNEGPRKAKKGKVWKNKDATEKKKGTIEVPALINVVSALSVREHSHIPST